MRTETQQFIEGEMKSKWQALASILFTIVLFSATYAHANYIETFDGGNTDLASTHLSRTFTSGTGTFEISPLTFGMNAPSMSELPISIGGDNELRYYEGAGGIAATHSYAITPDTLEYNYTDVTVTSTVSLGTAGGSRIAAVMSRVSGNSRRLDGYTAYITDSGDNKVYFNLAYMVGGIIHTDYFLAYGGLFGYDQYQENFLIELTTIGDTITASLSKVDGTNLSHLSTISVNDDTFSSGATGVFAFARGSSNIFFENVSATSVIPEPITLSLLAFGGLIVRRKRK